MDQIRDIVQLVGEVLGPEALGTCLHGSAVLGGLRPASDLDLLVVARRTLTDSERRALLAGLLRISDPTAGGRPVELTVVTRSAVRPWRYPPTADFQYGEWLRADYEAGLVPRPEPAPDLAVLLTTARADGRALAGRPPGDLLDPVPRADLARATAAGVPGLLDDLDADTRNVLLTLARVWCTLATGDIRAKDTAADWALERLPAEHRPVLAHARRLYLDCRYSEESWSPGLTAQVRPHAQRVLAEIGRLRQGRTGGATSG
ncbi:DUF4111 domain-containing protein [Streptomyces bambusae]|uniref:aminoglycoside adenylyltransferase family protein n=1 Tax=Streptomyces bambusae TaxID=1550616 RepID=UPI001CFCA326|nr:aminoglycoside adenylyltransferase family protein [Streptomyces bambusae]MCB5165813.1 DUF4111 domain-containing protein [Streptomyces bambusae]